MFDNYQNVLEECNKKVLKSDEPKIINNEISNNNKSIVYLCKNWESPSFDKDKCGNRNSYTN